MNQTCATADAPADLTLPASDHPALANKVSDRIDALHGLRFFAAFCILISHASSWLGRFSDNTAISDSAEVFTVIGMPLFFVLSGFVIHYNYCHLIERMRLRWAIIEFLGARLARIYPLFFCFLLVGIGVDAMLQWLDHNSFNFFITMAHALSLTQSWVYVVIFEDRLVLDNGYGLSWSLSTEFWFYLAYIVIVLYVLRLRRVAQILLAVIIISCVTFSILIFSVYHIDAFKQFAVLHMNDHFKATVHSAWRWFFYYSPYSRVWEFVIGCLTAQLFMVVSAYPVTAREWAFMRVIMVAALGALALSALIYRYHLLEGRLWDIFTLFKLSFGGAVPLAVVVFCVSRYDTGLGRWLGSRLLVTLGEWSYSIYTIHTWVIRIFERSEERFTLLAGWQAVFRIGLAIGLTIILASATYRLIEVPARRWGRTATTHCLEWSFGSRNDNTIPVGATRWAGTRILLLCGFAAMLGLVALYQFMIVPNFAVYTR